MTAVILGSAFSEPALGTTRLKPVVQDTPWGPVTLHVHPVRGHVLFRHGMPHRWLPNQIPWRAHAWALKEVGTTALLVTSSVGVLDAELPLYTPMLLDDLLMFDNRLPDGSACTVFDVERPGQGHLVLEEGLFSDALTDQVRGWLPPFTRDVVFAYVGGPRTKTAAENRWWAAQGVQVNSMSTGPEVVLANELEMPVAGLVIGHKYSVPGGRDPLDHTSIAESLAASRNALVATAERFLIEAEPVPFRNRIHRL